jgi:tripartite-type tricarboxylate transporter receptor subunit TctC
MAVKRRSLVAAGLGMAFSRLSVAQVRFPNHSISVVVAAAAGGPNDIVARIICERLSSRLGVSVVVDNKPGASGFIAVNDVKTTQPDGYRLLFASTALFAINPWLFKSLPYDPVKDFAPLSLVARVPQLLLVRPQLGVRTVAELVAWLRAHPTEAAYGSAGVGTPLHIAGELFCQQAGVKAIHIPYKGSSPAYSDLLGGRVHFIFDGVPGAMSFLRGNQLIALASTGSSRQALLPDVPTLAEAGVSGAEVESWFGFAAPRATPADVVDRLSTVLQLALQEPDVRARLEEQGAQPWGTTALQMAAFVASDAERWRQLVQNAGVVAE